MPIVAWPAITEADHERAAVSSYCEPVLTDGQLGVVWAERTLIGPRKLVAVLYDRDTLLPVQRKRVHEVQIVNGISRSVDMQFAELADLGVGQAALWIMRCKDGSRIVCRQRG